MTGAGRPLRFLVLVLGAWIGMRTWQLWPETPFPPIVRDAVRRVIARRMPPVDHRSSAEASERAVRSAMFVPPRRAVFAGRVETSAAPSIPPPAARGAVDPPKESASYTLGLLGMIRYGAPEPPPATARRWSASGWAIMRGSGPGGGVATPQLGGGQAGIRIARALDASGRVAIAARVASALDTRQQEGALGIEWRPTRLPIRVVGERRFGLANQRGGTAIGAVGGVSEQPLPTGFRLDGYAQVGAVLRDRAEGYADGAVRVARPVLRSDGGTVLSLGVGAWGAAQRGAQRLDVGPAAMLEVPLGEAPRLRIALEWRQRIAGEARPGSGPALSIGADY
jgi:hypothetical protein